MERLLAPAEEAMEEDLTETAAVHARFLPFEILDVDDRRLVQVEGGQGYGVSEKLRFPPSEDENV